MAAKEERKSTSTKYNKSTNNKITKGPVPSVQTKDESIIAIFCADIHLSAKPPIWRSAEPDWYEAMKRPLKELMSLKEKHCCPIFCAGDVFHKWNSSPELINFAIDHLPTMFAIPGQHDLPNHNLKEINKSAFWTLVRQGTLLYGIKTIPESISLWVDAFPFGVPLAKTMCTFEGAYYKKIGAVSHQYIWQDTSNKHEQAKTKNRIPQLSTGKKWYGYDFIVFGDNHIGFDAKVGDTTVFNCGSLMRRNSDQIHHRPRVGLLTADGQMLSHYLDTSQDKFLPTLKSDVEDYTIDLSGFITELEKLGDSELDFRDVVREYLNKHKQPKSIQSIIYQALESVGIL